MAAPKLVFTPITLAEGIRGEVLTVCRRPRRGLPENLGTVEDWRPWLTQLVADHSRLSGYAGLKYSRNAEVFRARFARQDNEPIDVVCRFNRIDGKGIPIFGQRSRSARNFGRGLRLLQTGIDTAMPLARLEHASGRGPSWWVTEYVADVIDLDQIVLMQLPQLDPRASHKVKADISNAIVELFVRLDDARLFHRDLKASNVLFINWDGQKGPPQPILVDLDGLHGRRWWNRRRRWQPLIRLAASLKDYSSLTRSDFARFLGQYLRRNGTPAMEWKARFRQLAQDATEYALSSQRRKRDKIDGFSGA